MHFRNPLLEGLHWRVCSLLVIASMADTSMAEGCSSSVSAEEVGLCCSCRCLEPRLLQDRANALPLPFTSSCTCQELLANCKAPKPDQHNLSASQDFRGYISGLPC